MKTENGDIYALDSADIIWKSTAKKTFSKKNEKSEIEKLSETPDEAEDNKTSKLNQIYYTGK